MRPPHLTVSIDPPSPWLGYKGAADDRPVRRPVTRGRTRLLAGALAVSAVAALIGVGAGLYWATSNGSAHGGETAERSGLSLGAPGLNNSSGKADATFPITYAIESMEAVDLQFCYLTADNTPDIHTFNVSLIDARGAPVASYDSMNQTSCVSAATGLGSSLLGYGGWISGATAEVVAGENLSIQIVPGETQIWIGYWTPDASLLTTLPV